MRRVLFLILCLFIFFGSAYAQRMSDEQVVEYVKQAQAAGKSQKQMTAELLRRGVTREQVLRIKDKYENSGVAVPGSEAPSQMRKRSVAVGESYEAAELDDQKAVVDERLESQSAPEAASIQIFGHNLAVIKTRPGYASSLAYDIDSKEFDEILGTIAGDDTIMLVVREGCTETGVKNALSLIIPNIQ